MDYPYFVLPQLVRKKMRHVRDVTRFCVCIARPGCRTVTTTVFLRDLAGFRVNEVHEFTCQAGHGNVAILFAKGHTLHRRA